MQPTAYDLSRRSTVLRQQRQQWDARLASFQRGLDHVMRCDAGDACGSSLCHATKRLMRSYATHDCTNPSGTTTTECKVCKLWGYLLAKHKAAVTRNAIHNVAPRWHSPTLEAVSAPASVPVLPPLSCGLAHARVTGGGRIGIIGGTGGINGSGRIARDARIAPRRRVIVTPELIKTMAKRV